MGRRRLETRRRHLPEAWGRGGRRCGSFGAAACSLAFSAYMPPARRGAAPESPRAIALCMRRPRAGARRDLWRLSTRSLAYFSRKLRHTKSSSTLTFIPRQFPWRYYGRRPQGASPDRSRRCSSVLAPAGAGRSRRVKEQTLIPHAYENPFELSDGTFERRTGILPRLELAAVRH